ncbi:MAG TPA: enoyl-CoA hydratase-related protein [Acidimicrobiales bacterium]|jgi:enoyl-CoA hydratase|nr:enoyl-CoA hydratase-related protein [Acidimicrobiales bacterium]
MTVVVDRQGAALVVRIDRPEARNALDPATCGELVNAFGVAEADDDIRCLVLTGTGDKAFCAGMDLKAFAAGAEAVSPLTGFLRRNFPKPIIAAVNGPALAGGFELVLTCDLVVAADHAWFSLPEVARGLFAAGGGTFLPRRLPLPLALELGLTGGRLDAGQALAVGLVNRVVPPEQVMPEALQLADAIAANSPLGVRATKALMRATAQAGSEGLWAMVDRAKDEVFTSNDAKEGSTAFIERRSPHWSGT